MIPIFILSNRGYTGKTFIALGLALKLKELGYKVGYMKPIGSMPIKKGKDLFSADAIFMKEALSLEDPLSTISPFVFSYEVEQLLLEGNIPDAKKMVMDAIATQKDKDFLIMGGAGDVFEGSILGINALTLMEELNACAVVVESWRGYNSMDTVLGLFGLLGKRCAGAVLNKVSPSVLPHVREKVKPFIEGRGVSVLGVFQKDSLLESITVRQLSDILNGRVLCCEERLDEFIEHFSIGAMDVDSALNYFRRIPNKAVITGAHRSDIQLAAMETSTKCIVLTGGLYANDIVIGKAQAKGIPILSVSDDTFTVIDKIEATLGKTRIREKGKIQRAKELIDKEFDLEKLLSIVKKKSGARSQKPE